MHSSPKRREAYVELLKLLAHVAVHGWKAGMNPSSSESECPFSQNTRLLQEAWLNGFAEGRAVGASANSIQLFKRTR